MNRFFPALAGALMALMPAAGAAESYDNVIQAELRPGWRAADGDHIAALHLRLSPGWKTYWRAPGDAGIPPLFDWRNGRNVMSVQVEWPAPQVFYQSGMRSVGYSSDVILPLRIDLRHGGQDVRLSGVIDLGICKEVCIPHRVRVEAVLPASARKPDPAIAAAMADTPYSASEAGVRAVSCEVTLIDGGVLLRTEIDMPRNGGREATVIETANPQVWVAEPNSWWEGSRLVSETRLLHADGAPFALDRSGVRITVLGTQAVDIQGCD
ncbi:MAG: protein-disulfide reductase DsbD family protein [Paracoccaceae bacterium]|nr:protein-disulfide reductase DsbD family protein [Paracoccaceae bacterium]